jgi:hypothetical protein
MIVKWYNITTEGENTVIEYGHTFTCEMYCVIFEKVEHVRQFINLLREAGYEEKDNGRV